jgi:hypothetical protein
VVASSEYVKMGPKASDHVASLNDRLLSESGLTQVDVGNKPDAVKGTAKRCDKS